MGAVALAQAVSWPPTLVVSSVPAASSPSPSPPPSLSFSSPGAQPSGGRPGSGLGLSPQLLCSLLAAAAVRAHSSTWTVQRSCHWLAALVGRRLWVDWLLRDFSPVDSCRQMPCPWTQHHRTRSVHPAARGVPAWQRLLVTMAPALPSLRTCLKEHPGKPGQRPAPPRLLDPLFLLALGDLAQLVQAQLIRAQFRAEWTTDYPGVVFGPGSLQHPLGATGGRGEEALADGGACSPGSAADASPGSSAQDEAVLDHDPPRMPSRVTWSIAASNLARPDWMGAWRALAAAVGALEWRHLVLVQRFLGLFSVLAMRHTDRPLELLGIAAERIVQDSLGTITSLVALEFWLASLDSLAPIPLLCVAALKHWPCMAAWRARTAGQASSQGPPRDFDTPTTASSSPSSAGSLRYWFKFVSALPEQAHRLLETAAGVLAWADDDGMLDVRLASHHACLPGPGSGWAGTGAALAAVYLVLAGLAGQIMILQRWIQHYALVTRELKVRRDFQIGPEEPNLWLREIGAHLFVQLSVGIPELLPDPLAEAVTPLLAGLAVEPDSVSVHPRQDHRAAITTRASLQHDAIRALVIYCVGYIQTGLAGIAKALTSCLVSLTPTRSHSSAKH